MEFRSCGVQVEEKPSKKNDYEIVRDFVRFCDYLFLDQRKQEPICIQLFIKNIELRLVFIVKSDFYIWVIVIYITYI